MLAYVVPRCCDEKKPVQLVAFDCFEAIYIILLQLEGLLCLTYTAYKNLTLYFRPPGVKEGTLTQLL